MTLSLLPIQCMTGLKNWNPVCDWSEVFWYLQYWNQFMLEKQQLHEGYILESKSKAVALLSFCFSLSIGILETWWEGS